MELHSSGEDYLKAILTLQKENGLVRAMDIAQLLAVKRPSVSRALKRLREGGLLFTDAERHIFLTREGREAAERILRTHHVLKTFLISIGVDPRIAEQDACRMEHGLSPETFDQLNAFAGKQEAEL